MKMCIYHSNCADGFGSAWIVNKALQDVEFHAGVHQDPPPDVTGKDVILVDFSYKRDVLIKMALQANSILILDHHKSAIEDLIDLPSNVETVFDMNRSGAMITWNYYFPDQPAPPIIEHIQDRDLWRFKLKGTREIQAAIFSYPYDFDVWDDIMNMDTDLLFRDGVAIERKHHKDVAELVAVTKRHMIIGGYKVPVANLPYTMSSDAGSLMAQNEPFAACYWDTLGYRIFSLRSSDAGLDVSEIANMYGGGGHKHAAGFRVPWGHVLGRS